MTDAIDLHQAAIVASPSDVADWPATLSIIGIVETPSGGFELCFDGPVPEKWKWPSNPAVPSENFQFTVWMFVPFNGGWLGAGLVQMWQGRAMGTRAIPPLFADVDGQPGYTRLWAEAGKFGPMQSYAPHAGDQIAIMVTAGNARLSRGVDTASGLSVRERSNVVLFPVRASDQAAVDYRGPVPGPTDPPPTPVPIPVDPNAGVLAAIDQMNKTLLSVFRLLVQIRDEPQPVYRGKLFGYAIVLTPDEQPPEKT